MPKIGNTVAPTTKFVIKYKLNGERRFEFAQLQTGTDQEAMATLKKLHGDTGDEITELKVSKAL
nr:hypothetical protein [Pseudomonas corrugata]